MNRSRYDWQPATTCKSVSGARHFEQSEPLIIFGSIRSEHDQNLDVCLKRIASKGLRLNRSKCNFLSTKLSFFGQIFTKEGTRPDPKKVNDLLLHALKPANTHEVRSFLRMANYSSKYIQNFATITAPLRELTKQNARFQWSEATELFTTGQSTPISVQSTSRSKKDGGFLTNHHAI